MSDVIVDLQQVSKYYRGVKALHPLDLSIEAGEALGLFGHNGAGKSTLMKVILGVLAPTTGDIKVLGHNPRSNGAHEYRRQFGYLPENVSFYDQLTGREVLNYFAKLKGHSKAHAESLLEEVNLAPAADRQVKTYSKGMRQRLGLAQAFLGSPKLLILDEPTVGLDPVATSEFYQMVDRLKTEGCAVILCSHVLPGIEGHIDRAMILSKGRKLALGSLDELRAEAALPTEIMVSGMAEADIKTLLNGQLAASQWLPQDAGRERFTITSDHKLAVMKRLLAQEQVQDLQLKQPSLEDLYHFYLSSTNLNSTGNTVGGAAHE
jgi:Cu-processing system ATP-binding protein